MNCWWCNSDDGLHSIWMLSEVVVVVLVALTVPNFLVDVEDWVTYGHIDVEVVARIHHHQSRLGRDDCLLLCHWL